jgi:hypothetical protein
LTLGPIEYRTSTVTRGTPPTLSVDPQPAVINPAVPPKPNNPNDRIYTAAEIEKMEEARQYHGSDPVVRKRLGLPSKDTGRLIR